MNSVRLGDIVTIVGGGTPDKSVSAFWNGEIPWASVKDFKSTSLNQTIDSITKRGVECSATNIIPAGAIIVPTRMAVGKAAINTIPLAINQDLKALLPKDGIYNRYLLRAILSKAAILESHATGATVKGITLDVLRDLKINLPSEPEQKRIASIIDKADALRQKRQQAIDLLDDLLRATFLDMFGDPVSNSKNWDCPLLGTTVAKITDGEHLNPAFVENGVPMIMANNVREDGVDFLSTKYVSLADFDKFSRKCNPENGDLLLVSRGATIGRSCLVKTDQDFCLMGSVILIKPNHQKMLPEYLSGCFSQKSFMKKLTKTSGSTAQQAIYLKDLKEVKLPIPPVDKQTKFASIWNAIKEKKNKFILAQADSEELFNSVSQRAFNGGL